MSPEEGAYVGVEVCRALDYAHRRMNVVHRDVTPRNVMVDEEGQVKVIDFGISTPVATAPSGDGRLRLARAHAPRADARARSSRPAADVFAVAVLLMELWSGKAPFRAPHARGRSSGAMKAPHPRPSDADIRLLPLDDVLASAMSLDPRQRPQQADDLVARAAQVPERRRPGRRRAQAGRPRQARARQPPRHPRTRRSPALQRPPSRAPARRTSGTQTFAAREEVPAATADSGGTRRIVSERLPPRATRTASPVREIETVATRPIESGPRDVETAPVARPARRVVGMAFVGAGLVAVAAFFLGKGAAVPRYRCPRGHDRDRHVDRPRRPRPPAAAPTAPSATALPATPTTARAHGHHVGRCREGHPRAPRRRHHGLRRWCVARSRPGEGRRRAGQPRRSRSRSPRTGESKGMTVTVKAADRVTLRADFTGATPTIRVQR